MGAATAGSATGITVTTDTDTIASVGAASGGINQPTAVALTIPADKRFNAASAVAARLDFTASKQLEINGKISLNFPSGFFAEGTTATAITTTGSTNIAAVRATFTASTATSIVITITGAVIPAGAAFQITLAGMVMGAATAGSATGITVTTDTDTIASVGAASGGINQPTAVDLVIADGDRNYMKAAVAVRLDFTTSKALATGGKITLNFPSGFFAVGTTATAITADGSTTVSTMTATFGASTATSIVITTAVAGIAAGTAFKITLAGMVMGAATAGSATGITVTTDTDTIASAGAPSGIINPAVTSVGFVIATAKRVPASTSAALTLSFKTTSVFQIGGRITLTYPSGFFATGVTPTANAANTASVATMTAISGSTSSTSFVITTAVAGIAAGTTFTITISGLTVGAATAGGPVTVQTDTDPAPSPSVLSGGLGTQVTLFTATPSATTLAASSTLVLAFTATTTVASGGTISFWFPTGWYDTTAAPTANAAGTSSVATLTATSVFSGNRITITTAVAAIPVGAFTITLSGLKTGAAAVPVGKFTLATSGDTVGFEIDSPALGAVTAAPSTKSTSSSNAVSALLFVSFILMLVF